MTQDTKSLKVILTSGRTIEQGISLVGTKTTSEGSIVVRARISKDAPHKGIAFMPLGIYANWITPPDNAGIGVPQYKGIDALIKPSTEKVPSVDDLLAILDKRK